MCWRTNSHDPIHIALSSGHKREVPSGRYAEDTHGRIHSGPAAYRIMEGKHVGQRLAAGPLIDVDGRPAALQPALDMHVASAQRARANPGPATTVDHHRDAANRSALW